MKYLFVKIKKHLKMLVQIVIVFGAAFLVLLYFLGYYDFSFLDRYAIFDDIDKGSQETIAQTPFPSVDMSDIKNDTEVGSSAVPEVSSPNNTAQTESPEEQAPTNVSTVYSPDELEDRLSTIPTISQSIENGCTEAPSNGYYTYDSNSSSLAKLTFDFKLPTSFSTATRVVETEKVITPGENGEDTDALISDEKYVLIEDKTEDRPSVELYMGYILLDNGTDNFILSSNGAPLCRYDADRYMPAYTRDRNDKPLFIRKDDGAVHYFYLSVSPTGEFYQSYIDSLESTDNDGEIIVTEPVTSFVLSDYDPVTDNRGLNFDYPSSFGKSDSTSVFVISESFVRTAENKLTPLDEYIADMLKANASTLEEAEKSAENDEINIVDAFIESITAMVKDETETLFGYEVRNAEGYVTGRLSEIKFSTAFPFMQNRAAVTTDKDRGSIYFITENGYRAFANVQTILNEHNRYVTEYLLPPLTHGLESMGSFYYDDGLVMVRRQVIDYWNYEMRGLTRVVNEKNCLLRLDGTEYTLPAGFELESYSDSMAILSKNGKYGVFDVAGEWIAQPIYASATPFISGLSVLTLPDGRCGMIDKQGNIVLPFTYDSISTISGNLIATYRTENGWAMYKVMDHQTND